MKGRVADKVARFELKVSCVTEEQARAVVDPFVHAWEISASLKYDPRVLRFTYDRCEPSLAANFHVEAVLERFEQPMPNYPPPPLDFATSPKLEVAYEAWCALWPRTDFLAALGYLVLTVLEGPAAMPKRTPRRRETAAADYAVELDVLNKLGELASEKGDRAARKVEGVGKPYTSAEEDWLKAVVRLLMLRLGELAGDPHATLAPITMQDLPALTAPSHKLVNP